MSCFARISVASDLLDGQLGQEPAYPANAWIWQSQTIGACRRRLGCPPFQSSSSSSSSHGHQKHRAALICRASSHRQKHSQSRAPLRRPPKHRSPTAGGHRHIFPPPLTASTAQNTGNSSSSSGGGASSSSCSFLSSTPLQQQQQAPVNPEQLTACINAATQYHQLEALCNTFLHNPAFSNKHAALVVTRLHKVHSRPQDGQLLLVELLAAKLAAYKAATASSSSCSSQALLLPADVAAVVWGFAKVGYQADADLLQHLLQQFWQQQQQEQQETPLASGSQQQPQLVVDGPALAMLVAGLAGLGCRDPVVWAQVRSAAVHVLTELPAPSLQQLLWGLATAQQSDAATTDALAGAVLVALDGFDAEGLAQLVWSFHVLGYAGSELFEQASQQMVGIVEAQQAAAGSSSSSSSRAVSAAGRAKSGQLQHPGYTPAGAAGPGAGAGAGMGCAAVLHPKRMVPQLVEQQQVALAVVAQQQQQQGEQLMPPLQRPQLPPTRQSATQLKQIGLQLPRAQQLHTQQHWRQLQQQQNGRQQQQGSAPAGPHMARLLGSAAAAAASQAYTVLEKYDPLLATLALYRDYFQPAHSC